MCVHTAISQCGHTCTLEASVYGSVAVGWIRPWSNCTHPVGPFPSTRCGLQDHVVVVGGPSPHLRSLDGVGQSPEKRLSRLGLFNMEKRWQCFVTQAEKTMSCMEKVGWHSC